MDRKTFLGQSSTLILGSVMMNPFITYSNAMANRDSSGDEEPNSLTLFLAGDVMAGRGIDQVLPHSVAPRLYERYTKSAKRYVELAERENGSIPSEVSYRYIWGEAIDVLEEMNPDAKIINLETAVTTSDEYWKNKGIHYRMHPQNTPMFTNADIDVCVLGNNHALDWGYEGLKETVRSLRESGLQTAGAGMDAESAAEPAILETANGRLLIFSYASTSAGAPMTWSAKDDRPGVNILPYFNAEMAGKVASHINEFRQEGDRIVLSLHWGSNWGYDIPKEHQEFAHRLIDKEAADLIFGHSSHHPKGMEVYKERLILYGCGDLINDYEGIGGHEKYRPDLRLMYFSRLGEDGALDSLQMIPMITHRFQLQRASEEAEGWLADVLDRQCEQFGHSIELSEDGRLHLRW